MSTSPPDSHDDIVTKTSDISVADTTAKFLQLLEMKQLKLFALIDQRAEALAVGLHLRETTLVIFGSPRSGTPVMEASPMAALDLPLKLLIWADGEQTRVSYVSPGALAMRYRLSGDLALNLAGIDALTDALVARQNEP